MKANTIKTQKEVRKLFWDSFPEFKNEYKTTKRQNQYSTDCRCSFVDFTDSLLKSGQITEKQADNYTL